MTSATSDPSTSSLSESWATLSNNSDAHSEDDWPSEPADNLSLIGHSTGDDVTSLDGRDLDSDVDTEDTESRCSESQVFVPQMYRGGNTLKNEHDGQSSFISTSNSIVFEEPADWSSTEVVELKRTIQVLDGSEATYIGYPFDIKERNLILSVQQSIVQQAVNVDQPFRVLYVGNPEFKPKVLDKLGDVLVASPTNSLYAGSANSSRFHVVPASFGPDATPTYAELLPLRVQLVVEECTYATVVSGPEKIELLFKDREAITSTRTDHGHQLESNSNWVVPDIAIFFSGANDDDAIFDTRVVALAFTRRHGIPSMIISEMPLWTSYSTFPIDARTLHICVETRDPNTGNQEMVNRFPVDLGTFENIAPAQLNRNIAALTGAHLKSKVKEEITARQTSDTCNPCAETCGTDTSGDLLAKDEQGWLSVDKSSHVWAVVIGIIMITLCCTGLGTIVFALVKMLVGFVDVSLTGNASSGSNLSLVPSANMSAARMPLLPKPDVVALSHCAKEKSLSVSDDILRLSNPTVQRPNNTDKFQVYTLGDCHVIIKVPSRISNKRKSPKFEVAVTKADVQLHFHLSKLFDDVYTLRLAREDAHGVMNVTISSKTKPLMEQTTEVDFGTPWLKIANWKKAAKSLSYQLRKDLSAAQTGLSEAYHRVSLDLQTVSYALRGETRLSCQTPMGHMLKAADRIMGKSRRLSNQIKEDTVKRLMISSQHAHKQAQNVTKGATEFVNGLWSRAQQHANRAHQSVKQVSLVRFTQQAKKSPTLAAAQKQAIQLARDSELGWKLPKFLRNGLPSDKEENRRK